MKQSPKKRTLAFRIRVTILLLLGVYVLSQPQRLGRFATTHGLLQSHSPHPEIVHGLFLQSPEPADVMRRIWETGKVPHRWEVINFLNRNLGDRPDLLPLVGPFVLEATRDPDLTTRLSALNLLRVIGHPDWRDAARALLTDPDPVARAAAIDVLQRGGVEPIARLPMGDSSAIRGGNFDHLDFKDFKRKGYSLNQFTNRPVLLHFFATWSPECISEIPSLVQLRKIAPPELAIVGVNLDGVPGIRHEHEHGGSGTSCCDDPNCTEACEHDHGSGAVGDFVKSVERHVIVEEYNYPVVFDMTGIATAQLEGSELPVHVLLDSEHRLIRRYAGTRSAEDHNRIVRTLLGIDGLPALTNIFTMKHGDLSPDEKP